MLKKQPRLLFSTRSLGNYIALGMWEIMLKYMEPDEALRQFNEWFPEGIEAIYTEKSAIDFEAIASGIIAGDSQTVIELFRKDILSQEEITQGIPFALQHLMAAYQAYANHFAAFKDWAQRDLFWRSCQTIYQRNKIKYKLLLTSFWIRSGLGEALALCQSLQTNP